MVISRISVINLGPGAAINVNITCTLLSDDLSIYDSRGLIAGSLSAGQSVWFELRVNRMGPYFESVMTSDEKVPLAQITVRHFDPIAREFESTAELVFD